MPKLGMEPIRRAALTQATIAEIGQAGTLDITVGQIAKRAGMSSALAHHYFGGKDDIFAAAMVEILRALRTEVTTRLQRAKRPDDRVIAIIEACFAPETFDPVQVNAWMVLYVQSRTSAKAQRLLHIYQQRLAANLRHALRGVTDAPVSDAETLAALIDGIYLHHALGLRGTPQAAVERVRDVFLAMSRTRT